MEKVGERDLYEVLQVSPNAHPVIVTKAFRLLAALFHPDNRDTGDEEAFKHLVEAYNVLSDPVRRAAYDRETRNRNGAGASSAPSSDAPGAPGGDQLARERGWRDERELRQLILRALYDVRRGRPYDPGLSMLVLAEMFGCTVSDLQYTLWYLRGKRFIETSQDSDLSITVDGVDHLESQGAPRSTEGPDQWPDFSRSLPSASGKEAEVELYRTPR